MVSISIYKRNLRTVIPCSHGHSKPLDFFFPNIILLLRQPVLLRDGIDSGEGPGKHKISLEHLGMPETNGGLKKEFGHIGRTDANRKSSQW